MSNPREPPEVAKISFQDQTDHLTVALRVIVHGDMQNPTMASTKGGVSYFFP